ncbi:MAG: hypothetical protein DRI37_07530 [Chloroflexi bacterium]|nr:MAG: hypothetical protein DRI37_07530 [Chloroflexota bacterium]
MVLLEVILLKEILECFQFMVGSLNLALQVIRWFPMYQLIHLVARLNLSLVCLVRLDLNGLEI